VFLRVATLAGLFVGLIPALAYAQTNLDEGKSPAQMFSGTCATCHKSTRGLAGGRGSSALKSYLLEHYTSGEQQAAALAAYVLGAGGGEAAPPGEGRAARTLDNPGRPIRPAGRIDAPATAKLQPPAVEDAKPSVIEPSIMQEPAVGPSDHRLSYGRRDVPPLGTRGRPKEFESAPPASQPSAIIAEPNSHDVSGPESGQESAPGPSAAVPADAASGEGAPIPRDNIPD
jgi:hypothetical protein